MVIILLILVNEKKKLVMKSRIAILVSSKGWGTNPRAIIKAVRSGKINGEITAVVSTSENAPAYTFAKENKVKTYIANKEENLVNLLTKKFPSDYIALAGWPRIIPDELIETFQNRILNIHPGLIPDAIDGAVKNPDGTSALWNKGVMTDDAMNNFLRDSTYAGSTLHFLSQEFDFGPVLGRVFEKIRKGDTIESLYKRLKVKENKLYVEVLARLCKNKDLNILVIGQNGREHALAVTYAKSKRVRKVFMTPGNGLTDFNNPKIKNYPEIVMSDFEGIVDICQKEKIDLVDVAQDDVIAAGYVDKLEALSIKAFGPTQLASQLEWDKEWARNFMVKYNLPIPKYKVFKDKKKAIEYINSLPEQLLFIKAAGLALGKGVIRAENKKEAIEAVSVMSKFGKSGETFLIEEALIGEEFSLFAICDGENFVTAKSAQDHKRIFDGDKGPNTGGVGSVAPTGAINDSIIKSIEKNIFKPLLEGMKKEGRPYKGILYLGGMVTKNGVKIIEFNCRWGDPEAEVILPSITTDYLDLVEAVRMKKLKKTKIKFDKKVRISIAGCSKGYPEDYSAVKGKEIFGLVDVMRKPGILVFGSGIKRKSRKFYVNGGRIFYVVSAGKNILEARNKGYEAMTKVNIQGNNLHFRKDIGWRDMERLKK